MAFPGDLTPAEQETIALVGALRQEGNLDALVGVLQGGEAGTARARDALTLLGELDPALLVEMALDTVIARAG